MGESFISVDEDLQGNLSSTASRHSLHSLYQPISLWRACQAPPLFEPRHPPPPSHTYSNLGDGEGAVRVEGEMLLTHYWPAHFYHPLLPVPESGIEGTGIKLKKENERRGWTAQEDYKLNIYS